MFRVSAGLVLFGPTGHKVQFWSLLTRKSSSTCFLYLDNDKPVAEILLATFPKNGGQWQQLYWVRLSRYALDFCSSSMIIMGLSAYELMF